MENPLPFLVAGSVNGSVYGLAGVGLVFAYRLSRTLNFAHGAIAMVAAFSYWQFHELSGWHAIPSFLLAIVAIPTAMALVTERVVFRPLADATIFAKTSATIGLLLALFGFGTYQWGDDFVQVPNLFPDALIDLPGVVVSGRQLGIVITALALTGATIAFLRFTAVGLRIRAVVDRPGVASLLGVDPARASQIGWVASYLLAGVSGVLLGPVQGGAPISLTLVVVFSLVAAAIGRMVSLPMTMAGGLLLGIGDALILGYAPQGEFSSYARGLLPMALLFAVLVLRARTLATSDIGETGARALLADLGAITGRARFEPRWWHALSVTVVTLVLAAWLGDFWTAVFASGVGHAIIFLSFVVFTSTTGLVSLAQGAFAGIGAFTSAILLTERGWPWLAAVTGGAVVAAAAGALVALPTVRLRGIFLVLATIAFGQLVESTLYPLVFLDEGTTGGTGGRPFARPAGFDGGLAYLAVVLVAFFALAAACTAFRRSSVGRALQADLWAPAGARSIGIRPERGRMLAFVVAAGVAGLGGAFLSGVGEFVDVFRWNLINGFTWLALVAIGGVGSIWGALVAAAVFVLTPEWVSDIEVLNDLYIAGFGVLGLVLLRRPGGLVGIVRPMLANRTLGVRPLRYLPSLATANGGPPSGDPVEMPPLRVRRGMAADAIANGASSRRATAQRAGTASDPPTSPSSRPVAPADADVTRELPLNGADDEGGSAGSGPSRRRRPAPLRARD